MQMYDLDFKNQPNDGSQKKTAAQMIDLYNEFIAKYPVVSIEDPFEQVRVSKGCECLGGWECLGG